MTDPVAADGAVDEDDWEWTIALARARASAEETAALPQTRPAPVVTQPAVAPQPPQRPTLPVPATPPAQTPGIDYDEVLTKPNTLIAAVRQELARREAAPATVIPVPTLPSIQSLGVTGKLAPVVRSGHTPMPHAAQPAPSKQPAAQSTQAGAPARFPKGTGPLDATARKPTARFAAAPPPSAPSHAVGDRTKPGIAMPLPAQVVELPSVKRRQARR
jgi:hypothetical protein